MINRIIKWVLSFIFKKPDPVEVIKDEAKETVDAVPNGQPMSDHLNKRLRD
jgi:hypothetical protein